MTNLKKVTAILLSLLMMIGALSVVGYAVNDDEDGCAVVIEDPAEITIDVKYVDADGNDIPDLGAVKPGDPIKARVYLGTNYFSDSASLRFYYTASFFNDAYPHSSVPYTNVTVNTGNGAYGADKITAVAVMGNTSASSATETALDVALNTSNDEAKVFKYDASTWLFELELTVDANASGLGGLYAKAADFPSFEDMNGHNDVPYGWSGDDLGTAYSLNYVHDSDYTVTVNYDEVTTDNAVTFSANGGSFGAETEKEVAGTVGGTYNIPADPTREGYTFLGWFSDDAGTTQVFEGETTFEMPKEQGVVYYAGWNQNVTVKFADTDLEDQTVSGGTPWTDKPVPTKDGYKFMGWEDEEGTKLDDLPDNYPVAVGDKTEFTYTAIWAKYVTITFDANGGTFSDGNASPYHDATSASTLYGGNTWDTAQVPQYEVSGYAANGISRPGYALMGWQVNGGEIITSFPTEYPEEDTTYTAVWRGYNVYIHYIVDNDAESVSDIDITTATSVKDAAVPYGELYTLSSYGDDDYSVTGWVNVSVSATDPAKTPGTQVTVESPFVPLDQDGRPLDVYLAASANEIQDESEKLATFDPNGGTWADSTTAAKQAAYLPGDPIADPGTLTREGYTFIGWTPAIGAMGADDITFTAIWEANEYTVTYKNNYNDTDDSDYEVLSFAGDEDVEYPADPVREGYEFLGWFDAREGGNEFTALPANSSSVTVYAQWQIIEYTITYDPDNGEAAEEFTIPYGGDIETPADPEKEGYTLDEDEPWIYEDADGNSFTGDTMPAYDLFATANWNINSYTINFVTGEGATQVAPITANYGASITAPAAPSKAGFSFEGWYTDEDCTAGNEYEVPATMPALGADGASITVYAKWNEADTVYTITVYSQNLDGETYTAAEPVEKENVTGAELTRDYIAGQVSAPGEGFEINTTKSAATFTVPAQDGNYDLYLDRIAYTYTLNLDGGSVEGDYTVSGSYLYGAAITAPAGTPVKEGYSFNGWSAQIPATMPAENVTVTAQWGINTHFAIFMSEGAEFAKVPYEYGAAVAAPAGTPAKPSYKFVGWTAVETGATAADVIDFATAGITMPDSDLTYYAYFELDVAAVNFYAFGSGTPLGEYDTSALEGSGDATIGTSVNAITAPEYENFTFKEWNTQADGEGTAYAAGDPITVPAEGINLYAIYDRVAVKLVPKDENSTAMIERDGVVETYNTALAATPYGVTEIKEPNAESYNAAGYETYYVYGLRIGLNEQRLAELVKVQGDGHYEVTPSSANSFGTGAIIRVYDNVTDELVEQFYIIIFGDLDGDSYVASADTALLKGEIIEHAWSIGDNKVPYLVKAIDLDGDGYIASSDTALEKEAIIEAGRTINQITGLGF